eukprot:m.83735 g.83735  ORF g.83735 m.83735 type:complete len:89 (-) comp12933_c0_seq2:26-292(-)
MAKKKSKKSGKKKKGGDESEGPTPEQLQQQANAIRAQVIDWHNNIAGPRNPSSAFQAYLERAAKGEDVPIEAPPPPKEKKKGKKKKKK